MPLENPEELFNTLELNSQVLTEMKQAVDQGTPAVLAIVIKHTGSSPGKTGFKALIFLNRIVGTVGGGSVEGKVIAQARTMLTESDPQPETLEFIMDNTAQDPGPVCGGTVQIYLEPIGFAPRVYVFGAGHVSYALADLLPKLGFRLIIIDDRKEFANPTRFPMAEKIVTAPLKDALTEIHKELTARDYIVIITRGHLFDEEILYWSLSTPAKFIGMIGSTRKTQLTFASLKSKGIITDQLKRVTSPIGLPIGSRTPEEIAISIAGQLIAVHRNAV